MPRELEIRVVKRNRRWEVSVGGVTRRFIDWLCTEERAIEHAIERARELGVAAVIVEDAGGVVREARAAPKTPRVSTRASWIRRRARFRGAVRAI